MINRKAAMAAGYTPEQINAYETQKKPQSKGFSLTDILPIAGGILGGTAGAAAGSILPGAGTVAGGIAGGGAGSAGGEWLRQLLTKQDTGQNVNYGDVAKEGAYGLAGGAAGEALGAGARLVGKGLTKALPERLMNTVFKEGIKDTKSGIAKGAETLGKQALDRGQFGTTKQLYETAAEQINNTENTLQKVLANTDHSVSMSDIRKTVDPLIKKYKQTGNLGAVNSLEQRLAAIETEAGSQIPAGRANEIKRGLYDEAQRSYGTEASSNMEGVKTVARGFKEALEPVPGVSQLNKDLSFYGRQRDSMLDKMTRDERNNILGLTDTLVGGGALTGIGAPAAVTAVVGKKVLGSTVGKTAMAQGLNKIGQLGEKIPSAVGDLASQTIGQGTSRGLGGLLSGQNGSSPQSYSTESDLSNPTQDTQETAQPQMTAQQAAMLMAAYPKQASLIKSIFDVSQSSQKSQKKTVQGEQVANLGKSGLRNIQIVESEIKNDPHILTKQLIPGKFMSRSFDAALFRTVDSLLRIRTGAAAPEAEVRRYMAGYGPQIGDDKATIKQKMDSLKADFADAIKSANASYEQPSQSIPMPYSGLGL